MFRLVILINTIDVYINKYSLTSIKDLSFSITYKTYRITLSYTDRSICQVAVANGIRILISKNIAYV